MNLNFLKSAFDRIGDQSKQLNQIAAASEKTAAAVTTGGVLYTKVDEIVVLLRQIAINGMASKKEALKDAKVLNLVGKAAEPLGKGFQLLVAALNDLPDAEVATKKMDALVGGLIKLGDVGKSILEFAGYMALAAPLMVVAAIVSPLLLTSLFLITKGLEILNSKVNLEGAEQFEILGDIGKSILLFGGSLALFGLIGPVAVLGALFASASILIISGTFKILEKMKVIDTIEKGAKALTFAALSILSIGASLALFDLVAPEPDRILQIGVVVGSTALIFGLIGLAGDTIVRGAKAMGFAALAIVGIGLSLYFFDLLVPGDILNMQTVKAFVVVGAITAGFLVAGKSAKIIIKGAGAMIVAGIAIIAIAFGLSILEDALPEKNAWERIGQYGAIVAGLGVAMALAGASAGLVALGAAQMIVAGIALIVVGAGIQVLEKALPKKNTMERIGQYGAVVGGLALAMTAAGATSPLILVGAGAMIVAGVATMSIAGAVAVLSALPTKIFEKGGLFGDSGQKGLFGGVKSNFEVMMDAIADGVAVNPVTAGAMLIGGNAFIKVGQSLILIGEGMLKFQKIANKMDIDSLKNNVKNIITSLSDSFATIGDKYKGGAAAIFTGLNPVAQGISATRGMGQALTGIAIGMQAMAELKFPVEYDEEGNPTKFKSMNADAPTKVAENAATITSSLGLAFGEIGHKYPGGIQSIFTGGNPVSQGISAVQGMGQALAGIATGVQEMANLRFPIGYNKKTGEPNKFAEVEDIPDMLNKVNNNLKTILFGEDMSAETEGGLISIFTSVGNPKGTDGSFLKSKRFRDGKEMLLGVGTPIKNLAEGVQAMADMKFPTGFDKDGNPKDFVKVDKIGEKVKKVNQNIKMILLGDGVDGSGGLVGIFENLGGKDDSGWFSASTIEDGAKIAKMISEPIKSIADAVNTLAGANISAEDISTKIKQFTQALIIGNGTDKSLIEAKSNLYQNVGTSYEQIGEAMPDIAEGLETSASAINNMNLEKLTEAKEMFEALATLTHGGGSEDILAQMGNSLENALERLAQMLNNFNQTVEEGNTGQQVTLEELNNTLSTLKESVAPAATGNDQNAVTPAPAQEGADMDKVVRAIRDLELMLDTDGIKVRTNPLSV